MRCPTGAQWGSNRRSRLWGHQILAYPYTREFLYLRTKKCHLCENKDGIHRIQIYFIFLLQTNSYLRATQHIL
ncbi:hypothetical protein UABAM_01417 [Candidatus Uabimicrobium amorphum]|uniref:Uncharacterized protein n=1 Tax=Uabimicrobium amorphum TaxID=2596890 RepID=A0A5S9IK82_UABAM|nr:hypothetical protein UABAM_01417 [Candidatus Uabimicrobium amorphum]